MTAAPDRARVITVVTLVLVTAAAWVALLRWPMGGGDMAGMQMVMVPSAADAAVYVGAWGVMMAAMMLPSALPMIGLYAATQRGAGPARAVTVTAFVAAYVVLWTASGLPIYFADLALMAVRPRTLAYVTAVALVGAGLFQFSALKQMCLRHCRSPLAFLLGHWRAGWRGALAMGWAHAWYCLGCCWALMVVLAVVGAMGRPWVVLIACIVAAEKLLPGGQWIARAAGVALTVLGLLVAVRPGLAAVLRALSS